MFSLNYVKTPAFWNEFREWAENKFNLNEFLNNYKWTYFILLITIVDSILAVL